MKYFDQSNVLVTCGGGLQGLTVLKNLEAIENVKSHLFDSNKENISKYFYDHFFRSTPLINEAQYEEEMIAYIANHQIDFVVPATQFDLRFLSDRKAEVLQRFNCKVAVPDREFLDIFLDKRKAHHFLSERGFPVQKERNPVGGCGFPLIGKPLDGWGGRGVVIIKNGEAYGLGNYSAGEYLWTDYVEEIKEHSIDFAVNRKGLVSTPVARERLSVSGGIALISESVTLPGRFLELIETCFSNPALSGVYNLQYVSCEEGLYVTDLNPRIGTSAVLGKRVGSNPIAHLLERPEDKQRVTTPLKVVRYLEEKYFVEGEGRDMGERVQTIESIRTVEAAKKEGKTESKREIAREMKRDGFPIYLITRYTGINAKEMEGL